MDPHMMQMNMNGNRPPPKTGLLFPKSSLKAGDFSVGFAITVPAQALTDRLHWGTVGIAVGFGVALVGFTRWFFRFGLKRYSGASA